MSSPETLPTQPEVASNKTAIDPVELLDRLNDRPTFTTVEEAPAVETKPEQNTKTLEDILEGLHETVAGALANQEQQLNELRLENESLKNTVAQLSELMELVINSSKTTTPTETTPTPTPEMPPTPAETTPSSTETSAGDTVSGFDSSSSKLEKPLREDYDTRQEYEDARGAYHVEKGRRATKLKESRKAANKAKREAREARRGMWLPELISKMGTARRSAGRAVRKGIKATPKVIKATPGAVKVGWDAGRNALKI